MRLYRKMTLNSRFLGLAAVAMLTLPSLGQQPPAKLRPDRTKSEEIEPPAARIVRDSVTVPAAPNPPARVPDGGKRVIESPTKTVLASSSVEAAVRNARETSAAAAANPTVKPGDVKWHASFAKACEASKTSGKPVLLFHMMGHLDKQFC